MCHIEEVDSDDAGLHITPQSDDISRAAGVFEYKSKAGTVKMNPFADESFNAVHFAVYMGAEGALQKAQGK